MKSSRKLLIGIVIAVVLAIAMAVPAFAAGPTTPTTTNVNVTWSGSGFVAGGFNNGDANMGFASNVYSGSGTFTGQTNIAGFSGGAYGITADTSSMQASFTGPGSMSYTTEGLNTYRTPSWGGPTEMYAYVSSSGSDDSDSNSGGAINTNASTNFDYMSSNNWGTNTTYGYWNGPNITASGNNACAFFGEGDLTSTTPSINYGNQLTNTDISNALNTNTFLADVGANNYGTFAYTNALSFNGTVGINEVASNAEGGNCTINFLNGSGTYIGSDSGIGDNSVSSTGTAGGYVSLYGQANGSVTGPTGWNSAPLSPGVSATGTHANVNLSAGYTGSGSATIGNAGLNLNNNLGAPQNQD